MLAMDTAGSDRRIKRALEGIERISLGLESWNSAPVSALVSCAYRLLREPFMGLHVTAREAIALARCDKKTLACARGLALQSIDGITT